jgi:peptidoglycan/LPS O-acetylase OafA/YrhL
VLVFNYRDRFAEGWSVNEWRDFLLRRVARIFPLYLVATVAGAVILVCRDSTFATELFTATDQNPLTPGVANLLLVQSWGMGRASTEQPGR